MTSTFIEMMKSTGIRHSRQDNVVYEKLITTKNKKHYAGILVAELGNLITDRNGIELPAEDRLDIKGELVALVKLL